MRQDVLRGLGWAALATALGAGTSAAATPAPGEAVVVDERCEPAYTVSLDARSPYIEPLSQGELAAAAQWVGAAPGRYLRVAGPELARGSATHLGAERLDATMEFLAASGANPALLTTSNYALSSRGEQHPLGAPSAVVVWTCWGSLPW